MKWVRISHGEAYRDFMAWHMRILCAPLLAAFYFVVEVEILHIQGVKANFVPKVTKQFVIQNSKCNGPPAKHVEFQFAHALGIPRMFYPSSRVRDPDMHHGIMPLLCLIQQGVSPDKPLLSPRHNEYCGAYRTMNMCLCGWYCSRVSFFRIMG